MVKVEHEHIALAAIHARMRQEIVDHAPEIVQHVTGVVPSGSGQVAGSVAVVVLPVPRVLALAAKRVTLLARTILEVELALVLELAAAAATFLMGWAVHSVL